MPSKRYRKVGLGDLGEEMFELSIEDIANQASAVGGTPHPLGMPIVIQGENL